MTDAEREWALPDWVKTGETLYTRAGKTVIASDRDGFVRYRTFDAVPDAIRFMREKRQAEGACGFILSNAYK